LSFLLLAFFELDRLIAYRYSFIHAFFIIFGFPAARNKQPAASVQKPKSHNLPNPADGLINAHGIFNQRKADISVSVFAKSQTRRYGNLGLLD
jgi:hypothetical protein